MILSHVFSDTWLWNKVKFLSLCGLVQTEPAQYKTGSLWSSPVQCSIWTRLNWAQPQTGTVRTGWIIGHATLQDQSPLASSPRGFTGKVTSPHSQGCELSNRWMESLYPARIPSTTAWYSSNLAQSRSPTASPNSLYNSAQVYLQTRQITASRFVQSLQVHLHTLLITASKSISNVAWSWPPTASPNSLEHGLGVRVCVNSIFISTRTLNSSEKPPAASRVIPCLDG